MNLVLANQATASKRQVGFFLVDGTDFSTPETGDAGGQPQISVDGAAWTNTGIGTLSAIGNGQYYAVLSQAVLVAGVTIRTRYKSANTAECPGESVRVVAFDPDDAAALGLTRVDAAISSRSTVTTAEVNAECDQALADYDAPTKAELDSGLAGLNDLSAAEVNEQVDLALEDYDAPTKAELDDAIVSLPTAVDNADAILDRDMAAGTDSGGRTPRNAFRAIVNRHDFTNGVVYKEDDTTEAWSYSKTTDAAAEPVTGVDPA